MQRCTQVLERQKMVEKMKPLHSNLTRINFTQKIYIKIPQWVPLGVFKTFFSNIYCEKLNLKWFGLFMPFNGL